MAKQLLTIQNIIKKFGGLIALNNVSLTIQQGEIYGLIGPNGAGKTTLFNVLTGLYTPNGGSFVFDNKDLFQVTPEKVVKSGISRTFQNIRLFNDMSVLENVMVGCHIKSNSNILSSIFGFPSFYREERLITKKSMELLEYVGIIDVASEQSKNLSYGDQRRLEIARALACEPKLLALDEPAAGMNPSETEELKQLMSRIRKDGVTILLIEHDMQLMMNLCDRIAVLEYGSKIAEGYPEEIRNNPRVIEAYLGATE